MNGVTNQLVSQIANALNSTDNPPVKDSVTYRIVVFKEKNKEKWVLALIPDLIPVEELYLAINESYSLFLEGAEMPCGIIFLYASQPELLVGLAKEWYYDTITDTVACF